MDFKIKLNFFYNVLKTNFFKISSMILQIIILFTLYSFLNKLKFGEYGSYYLFIIILSIIQNYGSHIIILRKISLTKDSFNSSIIFNSIATALIRSIIILPIFIFFIYLLFGISTNIFYVFVSGILLSLLQIFSYIFRGLGKVIHADFYENFLKSLILLISIIFFKSSTVETILLLVMFSLLVPLFLIIIHLQKKKIIDFITLFKNRFKINFSISKDFPLVISNLFLALEIQLPLYFLILFGYVAESGVYFISFSLSLFITIGLTLGNNYSYPKFCANIRDHKKLQMLIFQNNMFVLPIGIIAFFFLITLYFFYGKTFLQFEELENMIFLTLLLAQIINILFGTNFLLMICLSEEKKLAQILLPYVLLISIFYLIITFFYGALGVSITYVFFTFFLNLFLSYFIYKKYEIFTSKFVKLIFFD